MLIYEQIATKNNSVVEEIEVVLLLYQHSVILINSLLTDSYK